MGTGAAGLPASARFRSVFTQRLERRPRIVGPTVSRLYVSPIAPHQVLPYPFVGGGGAPG